MVQTSANNLIRARQHQCDYVGYMDDCIILCHTRWQLRVAIAKMHRVLAELQCRVHPNKRFIGATTRGGVIF